MLAGGGRAGPPLYPPAPQPLDTAHAELGRHLFHDVRLSVTGTHACATCHVQALAFTDGRATAVGATGEDHPRNTPTLTNVGLNATFGWAGEHTHLELQHLVPLTAARPVEMGLTGALLRTRLADLEQDSTYRRLLADAGETHLFTSTALAAIATFVRALRSFDAPWDAWLAGEPHAVTEAAQRGAALFFSERLRCAECHASINFSGPLRAAATQKAAGAYHNTGLYNLDGAGAVPDPGRQGFTGQPAHRGAFRAPTLRNVELTAPYMHDGSLDSLDAVLDHYAAGGINRPTGRRHPQQREAVGGFDLSATERADLMAFLKALTDRNFVGDPRLANPWRPDAQPFSPRQSPLPLPVPGPVPVPAAPPDAAWTHPRAAR